MPEDGIPIRERGDRIAARARARRREHTEAQTAVERNAGGARRLIESDELLIPGELDRARVQIQIAGEEKRAEEWHEAKLARYKARTEIRSTRAWILTVYLVFVCAWAVVALISGEATVVSPSDVWHYVASI